ncbi:Hypothetical_protein [Hexamita inflata]|uniref:Hypothetical_protein n=1 Tax=Hexamita inflata TaxID=28002 RepID=A0AA86NLK0_9EUKA|nr:Hypothetical protein HINF_LOCUS9343 [Hexamita inflata]
MAMFLYHQQRIVNSKLIESQNYPTEQLTARWGTTQHVTAAVAPGFDLVRLVNLFSKMQIPNVNLESSAVDTKLWYLVEWHRFLLLVLTSCKYCRISSTPTFQYAYLKGQSLPVQRQQTQTFVM